MKKLLLSFYFFSLVISGLKAQLDPGGDVKRFGLVAGANYSNMVFNTLYPVAGTTGKITPKAGFIIGLILRIPLNHQFTVQTEYSFSNRNAEVQESKRQYSLTYLSIPLLLKFKLANRFSLVTGPQADLLVFSKRTVNGVTEDFDHKTEERNVNLVLGTEFRLSERFNLNARYLKSLTNIGMESHSTEFKYSIFQLAIGFDF